MVKEAIILAGGLGTRLRSIVSDLPKCMAPVADQPFLKHVIRYLLSQGVEKFIFSLGYKHEIIERFLNDEFPTLHIECSVEQEPLGTGGAIYLACKRAKDNNVLVVNGDTLFQSKFEKSLFISFGKKRRLHCAVETYAGFRSLWCRRTG